MINLLMILLDESVLRTSGKIYTVVSIIGIIFICIVLYLIHIDRKLNKFEKNK